MSKIKKIIKKKNKSFVIILTGGYANLFKNRLTKNSKVEKDITIKGIIEIYKSYLL